MNSFDQAGKWKGRRVAVLSGGLSAERDISRKTGSRMGAALRDLGYEVVDVDPGRDAAALVTNVNADVVVVGLHGTYGEDGCIQGMLEVMGIPYTGSPPMASAVAMDKALFKRIISHAGIPTPTFVLLDPDEDPTQGASMELPIVVKPVTEGSSWGLTVVTERGDLAAAIDLARGFGDSRVLCEQYINGAEVTVGVLDGKALGTIQIVPATGLYDYEAKYLRDDTQYLAPAPLQESTLSQVHDLAEQCHDLIGCRGASRVDFLVDNAGRPWVIELNTLPGMTDHSLLPMAAKQAGMDFGGLCEAILDRAGLWHHPPAEAP